MNCYSNRLTMLIDLPEGRSVPVEVEFLQLITPRSVQYELLDARLDLPTLRTLTLFQAEHVIREAKELFASKTRRIPA